MTPLQKHVRQWTGCRKCSLCEMRNQVVLFRGQVPADVVMVGIGPGKSENAEGVPFWGPAGKLLDRIVQEALDVSGCQVPGTIGPDYCSIRIAYTNLVCCIPLDETGKKETDPESTEILACKDRLLEFIDLCRPNLLVAVGDLPYKWLRKWKMSQRLVTIIHPSAVLRRPMAMQEQAYRKNAIILRDVLREAFTEITHD